MTPGDENIQVKLRRDGNMTSLRGRGFDRQGVHSFDVHGTMHRDIFL